MRPAEEKSLGITGLDERTRVYNRYARTVAVNVNIVVVVVVAGSACETKEIIIIIIMVIIVKSYVRGRLAEEDLLPRATLLL